MDDIQYSVTVRSRSLYPNIKPEILTIGVRASSPTEAMKRAELIGYEVLGIEEEPILLPKRD